MVVNDNDDSKHLFHTFYRNSGRFGACRPFDCLLHHLRIPLCLSYGGEQEEMMLWASFTGNKHNKPFSEKIVRGRFGRQVGLKDRLK